MRVLLTAALATPLVWLPASHAASQSFLDGLARRAADRLTSAAAERMEGVADRAMSAAASRDRSTGEQSSTFGDGPEPSTTRSAEGARGPAPWPVNAGEHPSYTGDLEFDPVDEARAAGLHEFAKVECMECEGGYTFDSWITYHTDMDKDGVAAHVGGLAVGETLSWTGNEASGVLEVISETPIGSFPCKQVRIVMTRGQATYETPGLYCFGKSHTYAKPMWVEVL